MKHYLVTPFSLATDLQYSQKIGYGKSWNKHIEPLIEGGMSVQEAHTAYLYSKDRMTYRFEAFQKICVHRLSQAVESISDEDWKWYIYVTECMPDVYLDRLHSSTYDLANIEVIRLPYGAPLSTMAIDFQGRVNPDCRFSTTRLDDDDGIPVDLFSRICHFAKVIDNPFIYSNPKVRTVDLSSSDLLQLGDVGLHPSQPASGLTAVDGHVYAYGNHTQIKTKHSIEIVRDTESLSDTLCGCSPEHTTSFRGYSEKIGGLRY